VSKIPIDRPIEPNFVRNNQHLIAKAQWESLPWAVLVQFLLFWKAPNNIAVWIYRQPPIQRHCSFIAIHGGITRVVVNRHVVKKGLFLFHRTSWAVRVALYTTVVGLSATKWCDKKNVQPLFQLTITTLFWWNRGKRWWRVSDGIADDQAVNRIGKIPTTIFTLLCWYRSLHGTVASTHYGRADKWIGHDKLCIRPKKRKNILDKLREIRIWTTEVSRLVEEKWSSSQ